VKLKKGEEVVASAAAAAGGDATRVAGAVCGNVGGLVVL